MAWLKQPKKLKFLANEQTVLREHLERLDATTVIEPLHDVEQVLLDEEGRLAGKWWFTPMALRQFCQAVAPGLYRLLVELIEVSPTDNSEMPLAIQLFNTLVRQRFPRLQQRQLLIDGTDNVIEGVLGKRYRYFPNHRFWQMITQATQAAGQQFSQARLEGRRLALAYRVMERQLRSVPPWTCCPGAVFGNSETGECGVYGYPAVWLLSPDLEGACLASGFHAAHTGKHFNARVRRGLRQVLRPQTALTAKVAQGIEQLQRTHLSRYASRGATAAENRRKLLRRLTACGLKRAYALHCLQSFAKFPRASRPRRRVIIGWRFVRQTELDLAIALLQQAETYPLDIAEQLQRAVYSLAIRPIGALTDAKEQSAHNHHSATCAGCSAE